MIKLIATDMDGTFLDSSKRFSMEFFDIFEELRKRKIEIFLKLIQNVMVQQWFQN